MLKRVVISLVLMYIQALSAKTIVISDIDDTIKISHIRSKIDLIRTGVSSKPNFKGMDNLYRLIEREVADTKFFYITDTPSFISRPHNKFLERFNYPAGTAIYRGSDSTEVNKFNRFSEVIISEKPDRVILFGDNGQRDPLSFNEVKNKFPNVEFISFVRIAYPQPQNGLGSLLSSQIGFISAAEPAYHLMQKDIISSEQLIVLSHEVVRGLFLEQATEKRISWFMPLWQDCSGHSFTPSRDLQSLQALSFFINVKCK